MLVPGPPHVFTELNTTTCMRNGEWEPDPSLVECSTVLSHEAIIVAIFSSAIAFIAISVIFVIFGFACGYCFSQRRNKRTSSEARSVTSAPEFRITDKDVKLKGMLLIVQWIQQHINEQLFRIHNVF